MRPAVPETGPGPCVTRGRAATCLAAATVTGTVQLSLAGLPTVPVEASRPSPSPGGRRRDGRQAGLTGTVTVTPAVGPGPTVTRRGGPAARLAARRARVWVTFTAQASLPVVGRRRAVGSGCHADGATPGPPAARAQVTESRAGSGSTVIPAGPGTAQAAAATVTV